MPELLYPTRSRCRACRSYFDFSVILRRYCSRECAGLPEQADAIEDRPRKCRVWREGMWIPKACYLDPDSARREAEAHGGKVWYLCDPPDGCGMYHLATVRSVT